MRINIIKALSIFLFIITLYSGCTRDDICPEGSQSTPQLILKFRDISNPTQIKSVTNLSVKLTSTQQEIFTPRTDTIFQIPLNAATTIQQYSFTRDASGSNPNTDIATLNYERGEDVYINRACSFITTFENVSISVQGEGTANWMLNSEITNSTIENEDVTHITIFH